jgi:hypothetical protein
LLALFVAGGSAAAAATAERARRVLILSATADDDRIELSLEAIAFWNRTFAEMGLEGVLAPGQLVVASPVTRALENYARDIAQQAGRPAAGDSEPPPPPALDALGAEVVVLLSSQNLMQFAWPLPGSGRYFVAISAGSVDHERSASSVRRTIAHELGHVVGLSHHDDPTALMCSPCRAPQASHPGEQAFLRLTPEDRSRLLALYAEAGE